MATPNDFIRNILDDMRVELADMFDRNFERKGFFSTRWTPRKSTKAKGSLLHVTGKMRRSLRASVQGKGVVFTSSLPYTSLHNEGGKGLQRVRLHSRTHRKTGKNYTVRPHTRTTNMPQRQFIGDHPEVRKAVEQIITDNAAAYFDQLAKQIRK